MVQLWIRARPCLFYQSSPFIVHPPRFSPCLLSPAALYLLPFRVSLPHFQQEGMCVLLPVSCLSFALCFWVTVFCKCICFFYYWGGVKIMCTISWEGDLTWSLCECLGVWVFACQRWCVFRGICECVCVQALDTHHCTTLRTWRHLTLNNRCGCSEYLMRVCVGGGVDACTGLN